MLQAFLEFPWTQIGAFLGSCIAAITLLGMLGPRVGKWRNWVGENVQDMIGVGGLRRDMAHRAEKDDERIAREEKRWQYVEGWIEMHTVQAEKRDTAIAALADAVGMFVNSQMHVVPKESNDNTGLD